MKRKVLVTGGGSGIGRAVAERLLRDGASVVVAGRRADVLSELERAHPGRAFALRCDLAAATDRDGLLARAKAKLGGLDGVVLSAGTVVHELPGHITEAALREQLELNLVASLRLSEEALSVVEEGGGVVYVTSTLAQRPVVTSAVYSASKAGLLSAMKSFALAGAPKRIRFNAVSPGVVDTELVRRPRLRPGEAPLSAPAAVARTAEQMATLTALHPLGRLGTVEEVAETVLHLLSAGWMTGTEVVLDGGLLLRE